MTTTISRSVLRSLACDAHEDGSVKLLPAGVQITISRGRFHSAKVIMWDELSSHTLHSIGKVLIGMRAELEAEVECLTCGGNCGQCG